MKYGILSLFKLDTVSAPKTGKITSFEQKLSFYAAFDSFTAFTALFVTSNSICTVDICRWLTCFCLQNTYFY